jgi:hypothetical protein
MDVQTETAVPRYRHRLCDLPKCISCSEELIAPEASAFRPNGEISYLWCCDYCGQSLVTRAAKVH